MVDDWRDERTTMTRSIRGVGQKRKTPRLNRKFRIEKQSRQVITFENKGGARAHSYNPVSKLGPIYSAVVVLAVSLSLSLSAIDELPPRRARTLSSVKLAVKRQSHSSPPPFTRGLIKRRTAGRYRAVALLDLI